MKGPRMSRNSPLEYLCFAIEARRLLFGGVQYPCLVRGRNLYQLLRPLKVTYRCETETLAVLHDAFTALRLASVSCRVVTLDVRVAWHIPRWLDVPVSTSAI